MNGTAIANRLHNSFKVNRYLPVNRYLAINIEGKIEQVPLQGLRPLLFFFLFFLFFLTENCHSVFVFFISLS
jgi:hypothetical protein